MPKIAINGRKEEMPEDEIAPISNTRTNDNEVDIHCPASASMKAPSGMIVVSHALFLWGQPDVSWEQYTYTKINIDAIATSNITEVVVEYKFNQNSASIDHRKSYLIVSCCVVELWGHAQ